MCVWKVCNDFFFFFFDGVFGECNLQSVQINVGVFCLWKSLSNNLTVWLVSCLKKNEKCRWEHIKTAETPPISNDRYARIIS